MITQDGAPMKTDDTCPGCCHGGMTFTPDDDQVECVGSQFVNGVLSCPACSWFDDMALWQKGTMGLLDESEEY